MRLSRLLAVRADGHGLHYAFLGSASPLQTFTVVVAIADTEATLILPEWHPARPVAFPARLLPDAARRPGSWLTCTADLSQGRAAWLNVADLTPTADPGPERCHRAAYEPPDLEPPAPRPDVGPGCGDIVLELQAEGLGLYLKRGGLLDVHIYERTHATRPGDRVYLAKGGLIASTSRSSTRSRPRMASSCAASPTRSQ